MASFRLAGPPLLFRPSEFAFFDNDYMEKRQLFLRSYQFSRKQTTAERIRSSLLRVRRVVCVKLRRLRRLVWLRLRHVGCGFAGGRRRRFHRPSPFLAAAGCRSSRAAAAASVEYSCWSSSSS